MEQTTILPRQETKRLILRCWLPTDSAATFYSELADTGIYLSLVPYIRPAVGRYNHIIGSVVFWPYIRGASGRSHVIYSIVIIIQRLKYTPGFLKGDEDGEYGCTEITLNGRRNMSDTSPKELNDLFNDFWIWRLQESPEFATQIGIHDFDDRLESYELYAFERRYITCRNFLEAANKVTQHVTGENDRLNLKLLQAELSTYIEGYKYKGFVCPVNYMEGPQVDLERLVGWMKFETVENYHKLLSRYSAFPRQVEEIIHLMRYGMKEGITSHHYSMDGVLTQFDRLQVHYEASPFYEPFRKVPANISKSVAADLQLQGKVAIETQLLPAFKNLGDFILNEYMKALRNDISASSLPKGKLFYQQCLEFHTSTNLTADKIHQLGLQEVKRIEKEMQEVIQELGYSSDVKEFSAMIKTEPQFFYTNKEDLLNGFRQIVEDKINPRLPELFLTLPQAKLNISPLRESTPDAPGAFYLAGTADGRPGVFYVNTATLDLVPKYEMVTLALHESNPGHHLQTSFLMEMSSIPTFRRYLEDRRYSDAPSRFPMLSAYVEGWGLYSETLGFDLGLYKDPYSRFGHYSMEILRACRLVVDTGLHALGWSYQQAVDYMMGHTAATQSNIENEVKRYITWPGQACAYKVGELKIREFRTKSADILGNEFDIKKFHDVILRCAGPLSVLEQCYLDYIQSEEV